MNIIKDPYDDFWEYLGPENVLVIPTTLYVKKSNNELTVVHPIAKDAFKKFPVLPRRWGYLVSIGVSYPTYRSSEAILLGLPTKEHYAGKDDDVLVESSLVYLADLAEKMPNELFYLEPLSSMELTTKYLGATKNIVVLDYSEKDSE